MTHGTSLTRKMQVVTIGGGTGQMAVLQGLKRCVDVLDITAVVAMSDNGGSTGRLRDELGVLPPGDIRKCLIALSEDAPTMRALFEYRFSEGDLSGHSFGNIFLSALEKVTGSLPSAIEEASRILRVCGRVLPVTTDNTHLSITTHSGLETVGEKHLDNKTFVHKEGVRGVTLTDAPTLNPHVRDALRTADSIIIGPGDVYGSILPCLLVEGMRDVIRENTHARKILIANATNKRGISDGWTTRDYLSCIENVLGTNAITHCIANSTEAPEDLQKKYIAEEGEGVFVRCAPLESACTPIYTHLLKEYPPDARESFIRHDEHILAECILKIIRA